MNCMDEATSRPYRMRKRQDDIAATRQRIVEAAVQLHGSVGPAHTTFSAVAERAGVQRSTVYRHFPDEASLFGACTSHWLADHPWPRPDDWRRETADPVARLRFGLGELYRYYDGNVQMLGNSFRDIDVMPPMVGEFMRAQLQGMHAALLEAWPAESRTRDLAAALAHATDFRAWSALAAQSLGPEEAADLMATMVAGVVERVEPAVG